MNNTERVTGPGASHLLADVSRFLRGKGVAAYLVGGFVRDALQHRVTADIDIAVKNDAVSLAPEMARSLGGTPVTLDEENRISRIVLPGHEWEIDLTSFSGGIETDLNRRDFTINAIAYPLDESTGSGLDAGRCIDPFHGLDDLEHRLIRAVSDGVFIKDPVRLLRAVRIAAELGFSIDPGTEALMRRDSGYISTVAGERVREEFLRLLAMPGAGERLFHLDSLGLLTAIIPELAAGRGTDQPIIHVWDVLEHSIRTVSAVEFVLHEGNWNHVSGDIRSAIPWSAQLRDHFDQPVSYGSTRRTLLKLAALLHDIGKPRTKTMEPGGRARFLGHPEEGAAMSASILERLRFSRKEIQLVALLVKYHMRPTQMSNRGVPTARAIYRFFRDTDQAGADILFLCLADHLATRGNTLDLNEWSGHTAMTAHVLAEHEGRIVKPRETRLLSGHDIMRLFNIEPGPRLGRLLERLREAQATGEVTDRQQAISFIHQMITGPARRQADGPSQGEL